MAVLADFRAERATWCPGCGDFAVLSALQKAAVNLGLEPHQMVVVSGIGCSGKISQHFGSYGYHSLHGRSVPTATAVKLANRDLTVLCAGGDGDGYGIGLSHFIHAVRRNIDITYLVMDNHIYGLTTGQASPTSDPGMKTKTSPKGTVEAPIRPLELALVSGAGFVAQGFSGDVPQLISLIEAGVRHRGFSLINIFSPCVTFNKQNTYEFYREALVNLDKDETYDRTDRAAAIQKVLAFDGLVSGIIYASDERVSLEQALEPKGFSREPLATQDIVPDRAVFESLLKQFA